MKLGSIVEIVWDDATAEPGWIHRNEIEWPKMRCTTIGYYIKENDHAIMLMDSMFEDAEKDTGMVGGMKTIPKGMIVDTRVLRKTTQLKSLRTLVAPHLRPCECEEEE